MTIRSLETFIQRHLDVELKEAQASGSRWVVEAVARDLRARVPWPLEQPRLWTTFWLDEEPEEGPTALRLPVVGVVPGGAFLAELRLTERGGAVGVGAVGLRSAADKDDRAGMAAASQACSELERERTRWEAIRWGWRPRPALRCSSRSGPMTPVAC